MTAALHPYLNFRGNAREAFEFYGEALGGTPRFATFADFGAVPAESEHADRIMHGALEVDGLIRLYVSDFIEGMAPGELVHGNDVTLALMGEADDEQRLTRIFEALSEGGEVSMPLGKQVWGGIYGAVTDRFGILWQVNIGG
ncbi:VOC family protein [Kocuria palustris]|uniref:VOC family protein n=1 Tax=Kocuria palustris TaxID=71999 RepID=UPI0011A9CD76|nr:VOC family protein [Kocuria palustris]